MSFSDGIDRNPSRFGIGLTATFGLITVLALVSTGVTSAAGIAVIGAVILVVGTSVGNRRALFWGVATMVGAAIFAGVGGAPAGPLLMATVAAIVAWDAGTQAVSVGRQLGRSAPTRRVEVVHVGITVAVGGVGAGFGYVVYRLGTGGQPVSALVVLLAGAVLLTWALRN